MKTQQLAWYSWCMAVAFLAACAADEPFSPQRQETDLAMSVVQVTDLIATAESPSEIRLAWQDRSRNESGFEVHRSTAGPNGEYTLRAITPANATNHRDVFLAPTTTYCYKVRTVRSGTISSTYSSFSPPACATTFTPPPPSAPADVAARPQSSRSVEVRWASQAAYVTEYRVERSLDGGATWAIAFATGATGRSGIDADRAPEVGVCYRVTALYEASASAPSSADCTIPPAGPTGLTENITWLGDCCVSLELNWIDNSNVEEAYEVWTFYWDAGGPVAYLVAELPANSTSFYTEYYSGLAYLVYAVRDGGRSDPPAP